MPFAALSMQRQPFTVGVPHLALAAAVPGKFLGRLGPENNLQGLGNNKREQLTDSRHPETQSRCERLATPYKVNLHASHFLTCLGS
jgi:hypothetical protein